MSTTTLTKQDLVDIRGIVVSTVNEAIDQLVTPRFDELDNRMDGLDGRMDSIDGRMHGTEDRLGGVEGRLVAIQDAFIDHSVALGKLQRSLNELRGVVGEHTLSLHEIKVRLTDIENKLDGMFSDIKELYSYAHEPLHYVFTDRDFDSLTPQEKITAMNKGLSKLMKQVRQQVKTNKD
jgi:hypothetical protein